MNYCFCFFGLNGFMTSSLHSINGPSIKSIQYGTVEKQHPNTLLIDFGFPGRFIIKLFPRRPEVCLDKIAVGVYFKDSVLINSPKPGIILSQTASVASGVTSLFDGPVPSGRNY